MITAAQQDYIELYAYVPEHIPQYVTAVSQTEPFLFGDFLVYAKKGYLILIGYPLKESFEEKRMGKALKDAVKRFKPEVVSIAAPALASSIKDSVRFSPDHYHRLDLSSLSISQKLRNMLKRAGRELSVERNRGFDEGHKEMIADFLKTHPVDDATQFIFQRIEHYVRLSESAWIFDARNERGELVAFDIAEFKAKDYAFYMFNFSSASRYVPGASDLLLSELVKYAMAERKKYLNLGLGIDPGVTFFKKKWGGSVFLPYASCLYHPSRKEDLDYLLQKL